MNAILKQLRQDIMDHALEVIDILGIEGTIQSSYNSVINIYAGKVDDNVIWNNVNDIVNGIEL